MGRLGRGKWKTAGLVVGVAVLAVAIGTAIRLAALQPSDAAAPNASPPVPNGDVRAALSGEAGFRVLFVGNSLTYFNDLPKLLARLASGVRDIPRPFLAVGWTPGGSTLADAEQNPSFRRLLAATRWNVIVLQEGTPLSSGYDRNPYQMDSDVATLSRQARSMDAIPILFETWGNRTGTDPEPYGYEQSAITANYAAVGKDNALDVAPAGTAWAWALDRDPSQQLWASDGHHPALAGSYLAASVITTCISYALSHHRAATDPTQNAYTAGLDPTLAQWLRHVAWHSVRRTDCDPVVLSS